MRKHWIVGVLSAAMFAVVVLPAFAAERRGGSGDDAAADRARETVRMLDDIYKTAIVLITDNYVQSEDDFPAGAAAVAWFDAIQKKGWPSTRLVDASGDPVDDDNLPRDAFEKKAIAHLKAGNGYYEQIVEKNGKRYLRAATAVPVVMQKCTMCHENYKSVKAGEPIGALSYTVEIK